MGKAPSGLLAIAAVTKEDELRIANEAVSHRATQALTSQFHALFPILSSRMRRGSRNSLGRPVHFDEGKLKLADCKPLYGGGRNVRFPPIADIPSVDAEMARNWMTECYVSRPAKFNLLNLKQHQLGDQQATPAKCDRALCCTSFMTAKNRIEGRCDTWQSSPALRTASHYL